MPNSWITIIALVCFVIFLFHLQKSSTVSVTHDDIYGEFVRKDCYAVVFMLAILRANKILFRISKSVGIIISMGDRHHDLVKDAIFAFFEMSLFGGTYPIEALNKH